MQTCFETGNDKLYLQVKNKIIYCPRKFATGLENKVVKQTNKKTNRVSNDQ